jgi:squalene synthase HpnC
LSAFRQDVTVTRYAAWVDVMDYCRRSANPVGRLVLRIAGYHDARLDGWADAICTALQLTNFWQDLKTDFDRGRLYVPEDEMRAHGAVPGDLAGPTMTAAWTKVLAAAVGRTRALFRDGRPLCDALRGRLGYELRATWLGGTRILDRIEASEYDMIQRRPSLGAADAPWFAWRLLSWSLVKSGS